MTRFEQVAHEIHSKSREIRSVARHAITRPVPRERGTTKKKEDPAMGDEVTKTTVEETPEKKETTVERTEPGTPEVTKTETTPATPETTEVEKTVEKKDE